MASTIDVLAIGLEPSLLAETAVAVAAEFGLVASVAADPVGSVRFERDRARSRSGFWPGIFFLRRFRQLQPGSSRARWRRDPRQSSRLDGS